MKIIRADATSFELCAALKIQTSILAFAIITFRGAIVGIDCATSDNCNNRGNSGTKSTQLTKGLHPLRWLVANPKYRQFQRLSRIEN